jgi:hypothetical protein
MSLPVCLHIDLIDWLACAQHAPLRRLSGLTPVHVCWSDGIYRAIPFVFEIRTIMDWMIERTTLKLGEWFQLEDISASLYKVLARMYLTTLRAALALD